MTPFLILVGGISPVLAVGTDLVYTSVTKIAAAWLHWRQRTVELRTVFHLACGSLPAGTLGFYVVSSLHRRGINTDEYVRHAIGVVLVAVALILLFKTFYKPSKPSAGLPPRHVPALTIAWGALVGFTVGMTSLGSGSLIAPFLMVLFPKTPARVVGTDVFHAALLVTTTALLYINANRVEWHLVPVLLAGSLPGVLLGTYLATRLPVKSLRLGLSMILFVTGIKLV
jgi:uncharacterized membrane protein YfcA